METLFIGRNLILLPEVQSTNSYAMNLLKNVNPPEGTVVYSTNQTQGKGQRGSSWISEPSSSLAASFILKPAFLSLKNQFFLYQVSALACYDTLAEILDSSQFDIKIKWPNDMLVNKKKIAGILIENNILNNQIIGCVIGIGINVNQQFFESRLNATSLKILAERVFSIDDILNRLCMNLETHYLALKNNRHNLIMDNYLQHFFGLNRWMDFEINDVIKTLMVTALSDRGLLLLREKNGTILEVDVKEVKWLY